MAKYQKYAEYKDSGVEWLGEIPNDWKITSLKRYSYVKGGYAFSSDIFTTIGQSVIRIGDIQVDGSINLDNCKYIPDSIAKNSSDYLVKKGQILMAMTGATIGKAGIYQSDESAYLNQRVGKFIVDSKSLNYDYLWYLLKTHGYQEYIRLTAFGGAQPNISDTAMVDFCISIPSLNEQSQIANFLDHETAKIDTLIAKQEKLIELLKEKRQAVISHAVTKGLNPNVPMKDSGNIWAKSIPHHWKLTKLTYVARVGNGATPSRENQAYWKDGSIGWLNSSKVNDVVITEADQFITPLAKNQTSVQVVQYNDLVMAITGEGQTRGRVAICQIDATINQHLASIRITDTKLNHEFLFYWLTANYERIRYESTGAGSTKGAITCGDIGLYPVPLPPHQEQLEIVASIKKQSDTFKNLIAKAESAIQLMQERRTALISAAVTGKIDVRSWQHPNQKNNNNTELSA